MTDTPEDVMKSLPVAQPERKPFEKTDQRKVSTKDMPPARTPLPEKVASTDGKGGVVHRGKKK